MQKSLATILICIALLAAWPRGHIANAQTIGCGGPIFGLGLITAADAQTISVPCASSAAPPVIGSLVLEDSTSFILLEDNSSHLCLEGGC